MRPIPAVAVAFLLPTLLVACNSGNDKLGGESAGETAKQEAPAGDRVAALSEGQRNAVFVRAIRDAGLGCQGVEKSIPAGHFRDLPLWTATCSDGRSWTIVVPRSGVAQIFNADQYKLVEK
jgi:hypothetical protein